MSSASKGQYARGGGGDLRDITRAANEVLGTTTPPTGMSLYAPGAMAAAASAVGGPLAGVVGGMAPAATAFMGVTSPTMQRLLRGDTLPQSVSKNLATIPLLPEFARGLGINAAVEGNIDRY